MRSKPQSPIWPYLGILACLFVLSVTAPRAWDRLARHEPLGQFLATRKASNDAIRPWPAEESTPTLGAAHSDQDGSPLPPATGASDSELDDRSDDVESPDAREAANLQWPTFVPPAPEFAMEVESPVEIIEIAPVDANQILELVDELVADHPSAFEKATTAWPLPRVLVEQLNAVVEHEPGAIWARQALGLVGELCRNVDEDGRSPAQILGELRAIANDQGLAAVSHSGQTIRARYALTRWLDVWDPAASLDETRTAATSDVPMSDGVAASLSAVEQLLARGAPRAAWRKYLRLDAISRLASDSQASPAERREVAGKVLDRIHSPVLTQAQLRFLAEPALVSLASELRSWAAEPVGSTRLLAHMDAYERSGLPSEAKLIANDWRGLRWQNTAPAEQVSKGLETHYRNANLRLALSSELLNRWIPQPDAVEGPVRDRILDVPVRGWNTTFTDLSVRLVPDPRRIRVGLEADGLVASNTVATSGPARFHNRGQSTFLVRKLLVVG
ncbi:MAG: hypothetical protein WD845_18240, partial [Pirellulales bacterium]